MFKWLLVPVFVIANVSTCLYAIIHSYLNGLSPSYPDNFSPYVRIKVMSLCFNVAKKER